MPDYEYICKDCGHEFSLAMSFEEYDKYKFDSLMCGNCGKTHVERNYKPLGTIYKGTGFYTTDKNRHTPNDLKVGEQSKNMK
jgi:putative FmdB family regulatory protein